MNAYVVTARELSARVTVWPDTGDPVTVSFEYECYCSKTQLVRDHYRGVMILCRCGCAVRGLVEHPGGRGLICSDCRRKVQAMFDRREAWGSSRKPAAKPVQKSATAISEISENKPAIVSGSGSPDLSRKKISANKKGKFSKTSIPADQIVTRKKATNVTRLRQNATAKKGAPKRRRNPARKAA